MTTSSYMNLTNLLPAPERARLGIIEMIRTGQIASGNKIDQREIAKKLNLTTAPVREAFGSLESEGLLQKVPGVGIFCKAYTVDEIEEVIEIRGVLEGLAARRAAERITEPQKDQLLEIASKLSQSQHFESDQLYLEEHIRFHSIIAEISQSQNLIKLLNRNHIIQQVLCNISASIWPIVPHDHQKIAEAICSENPDWAEEQVKKHIAPTYKQRLQQLRDKYGENPIL